MNTVVIQDESTINDISVVANIDIEEKTAVVQEDTTNHDRNLVFKTVSVILIIAVGALFLSVKIKNKNV